MVRRLPALFLLVAAPLVAQAPRGSSVRGTVTAGGRPLAGTRIVRSGTSDTARSDSAGRYTIDGLTNGRHIFAISRSGFESVEMELTFTKDTTLVVDIPLEPRAGGDRLAAVGFEERRTRLAGERSPVTFLGMDEIAERGAVRTSQLFDGVRDISTRIVQSIPVVYGADGRCIMNVWVDGTRASNVFPTSMTQSRRRSNSSTPPTGLDDLLQPREIAGIEIYPRPSQVPQQFQAGQGNVQSGRDFETRSADCGAIILWSRR